MGLFTFVALVAGVLFNCALKRNPQGGKRVALIIVVSVFVSFVASALSLVNMVMLIGGYEKDIDGVVFAMSNHGTILASNDGEKFKVGTSFLAGICTHTLINYFGCTKVINTWWQTCN